MRPPGHALHGWGLLIVSGVLALLLAGVVMALTGVTWGHPIGLALIGGLTLVGLAVGSLWHRGRIGWAWTLLLVGPGLLVLVGMGVIVWAAASYSLALDGF